MIQGYIEGLDGGNKGRKYVFKNVYSEVTPTWSRKTDKPTNTDLSLQFITAALGKIYFFPSGECYDPEIDTWSNITIPPSQMNIHKTYGGEIDGKIYLVYTQFSTSCNYYDIKTGTWSAFKNASCDINGAAYGIIDGKIHIAGGYSDSSYIKSHSYYDSLTNSWGALAALPSTMTSSTGGKRSCAVSGNMLYALEDVRCYNANTKEWTTCAAIPLNHKSFYTTPFNEFMYALGGAPNNYSAHKNEVVYRYNTQTNVWEKLNNVPRSTEGAVFSIVNGKIYMIGGIASGNYASEVNCYDLLYRPGFNIRGENSLLFDKDVKVGSTLIPANILTSVDAGDGLDVVFENENTSGEIIEKRTEILITTL